MTKSELVKYIGDNIERYRQGGDGCIAWAEDNVCVEIYPEGSSIKTWVPIKDLPTKPHPQTGRSCASLWEEQKRELRKALELDADGLFRYMLIVWCWPRGETKSFLTILIQLWKFFCWPSQEIVLCANSKDQVTFVHYEEMTALILNSPRLLTLIGRRNVQAKEIRFRDDVGNISSKIQPLSSFSGIVSNITGYTFSEIFEQRTPRFWEKVDGSIRNVPMAMGVIDTTVSPKNHFLYALYESYKREKDEPDNKIYFSYRYSETGDYRDYWHPNNTQAQLKAYKSKFVLGGFERYFLNLWSAGAEKVFSVSQVQAINYIGAEKKANCHNRVVELLDRRSKLVDQSEELKDADDFIAQINRVDSVLWPVEDVYGLRNNIGLSSLAPVEALDVLGDMYDTEWGIVVGIDRAQPMKRRTAARTIIVAMAKGLIGSKSNPYIGVSAPDVDGDGRKGHTDYMMHGLNYVYFLLGLLNIEDSYLESMKAGILSIHDEYGGIDSIGSETWGVWDLVPWALAELDVEVRPWQPTYDRQLGAFTEFYSCIDTGRFKAPPSGVPGSKRDDIVKEEMEVFDHDLEKKQFGSPEKSLKYGVQDDCLYAIGWGLYGGRFLGVDDFRSRGKGAYFGTMLQPTGR